MNTVTWQLKARLPSELKTPMHALAQQQERSINYLFIKAITEYVARNSSAPVVAPTEAEECSANRQERTTV
jgi:predicted transcriptional regulator